jgi:photosystem II stability/assembly factor-like uncharacterized protein
MKLKLILLSAFACFVSGTKAQNSWSFIYNFNRDTVFLTNGSSTGYNTNSISKVIFNDDNTGMAQTLFKRYVNMGGSTFQIPESTSYQLRTLNGGATWDTIPGAYKSFTGFRQDIQKCGRDTIVTGYANSTFEASYVYYSTDHGVNWNVIPTNWGPYANIKSGFHFISTRAGYYFSRPFFMRRTGNTYVQTTLDQTSYSQYTSIVRTIAPEKVACILDDYKRIVLSQDSGITWSSTFNSNLDLNAVAFADELTGYVSCDSGKVLKTTDGGMNWTTLNTGANVRLNTIEVYNDMIAWAGGNNGIFLTTFDGGATWQTETLPDAGNINSIQYTDSYLTACTNKGNLYRTWLALSAAGVSIPENDSHAVNGIIYPNPTGDSFKLRSAVALISYEVFDASGKSEGKRSFTKEGNTYAGKLNGTAGSKLIVSYGANGKVRQDKIIAQ